MKISILTLFPEMFEGPFSSSIIKHAVQKRIVEIKFVNIRDYGIGTHKVVDDTAYGGGIGMVMRVDVLKAAIDASRDRNLKKTEEKILLMTADGHTYSQRKAEYLSSLKHIIIVCGHYEGFDERIREFIDEEISIGDFVLTGGEIPSMLITDSVVRLLDGVLKPGVTDAESFSQKDNDVYLLEYPQFTRPQNFEGREVPPIMLSGDHKKIALWRKEQARARTLKRRPDLLSVKDSPLEK